MGFGSGSFSALVKVKVKSARHHIEISTSPCHRQAMRRGGYRVICGQMPISGVPAA